MRDRVMRIIQRCTRSRAAGIAFCSYLAFIAHVLCTLVSIPLAVRFLDKEQIALWTLASQLIAYLVWMDFGIGDAVGRKIAKPIADDDQPEIHAWWTLSLITLAVLGVIVLLVGAGIWPLWIQWFQITPGLRPDAAWLFTAAVVAAAVSLPIRTCPGVLLAQQRFAWVPASQTVSPIIQLIVFAICLHAGWGVKAYFIALAAGLLAGWAVMIHAIRIGPTRLQLTKSAFTKNRCINLFQYSGSVMLVGLNQTLVKTLPSILLGRFASLAAIPVYQFTTRIPEILTNLTQRTGNAFYPALQAHHVADQKNAFLEKFREVQGLHIALGLITAGAILALNRTLLTWLAAPEFFAGPHVNFWLAIAAVAIPFTSTSFHLLHYSGNMGKSGLVSCLPTLLGAPIAFWMFQHHGMAGIAATFAILPLLIASPYASWRGSKNSGLPWRETTRGGTLELAAAIACISLAAWICSTQAPTHTPTRIFGRTAHLPGLHEWLTLMLLASLGTLAAATHLRRIRNISARHNPHR